MFFFAGSAFSIFRAPLFILFGTRGLYLFGLRFFYFSGPGFYTFWGLYLYGLRFFHFSGFAFYTFWYPRFVSFRAPLFLFFGPQFLHLLAPEVCVFMGSAFLTFWLPTFASLRAPVFHFSGSGFYPFHYLGFASVQALLLGHQNVQEIPCANIYIMNVQKRDCGPQPGKIGRWPNSNGTTGEMTTGTELKSHAHHPTHLHANDRLPTRVCTQSSWTVINVTVVPYKSVRLALWPSRHHILRDIC